MTKQKKLEYFSSSGNLGNVTNNASFEGLYDLPDEWEWTRLGRKNIAEIIMGQSPQSKFYNKRKVGLPFYQGKADFGEYFPTPRFWCSKPNKIALKGDILISVRAPVGPVNMCQEKSCIGRGLAALRSRDNVLVNSFLFYYLKRIEKSWVGKGSTFKAIGKKDLENLLVPLPPLCEQKLIVSKVDKLLSRIDEVKRIRKKSRGETEKILQAALHHVFSRAEEEEWPLKRFDEFCKINPSKSETKKLSDDLEVTFVPMRAVSEITGRIQDAETRILGKVKKGYTYFKEEDVLFAKITPCMENGKSAVARNLRNKIGFGSTEFHVIRPLKDAIPEWVYYFVRQESFRETAARNMTGTVGHQRVPKSFLEETIIPLPSLEKQKELVSYFNNLKEKSQILRQRHNETDIILGRITPAILDKAFKGKLV